MQSKNKRNIIVFWAVVLVAAVLSWYFLVYAPSSQNTGQNQIATTTPDQSSTGSPSASIKTDSSYVITQPQPQKTTLPEPSLDRPLPDTSKLDPRTVSVTEANMQTTIANLKANKNSFQDWVDLGFQRKTLGDYAGAALYWEYVSELYPQNSISFGDLGDLYTGFLPNIAKAEANYVIAIKNVPTAVDAYRNLFNLYISEKKNAEALALLQKGVKANSNTFDLQLLLARYYRDAGNTTLAKTYYDQAISIAQKLGNTSAVQAFQSEEAQVK